VLECRQQPNNDRCVAGGLKHDLICLTLFLLSKGKYGFTLRRGTSRTPVISHPLCRVGQ
jgi:hypothetical protein